MIVGYQLVPWVFMYHLMSSIYISPWHFYISLGIYISSSVFIYLSRYLYISLDIKFMGIYTYISMAFIYLPRYLYISLSICISPSVFTGHLYKSMGIYILLLVFTNTCTLLSNYETHGTPYTHTPPADDKF